MLRKALSQNLLYSAPQTPSCSLWAFEPQASALGVRCFAAYDLPYDLTWK